MDPLQIVLQFLHEEGYQETFATLERESSTTFHPENLRSHILRQSLGEMFLTEQTHALRNLIAGPKLSLGPLNSKSTYSASPVALCALQNEFLVGFTDSSIRKVNLSNQITATATPKLGTVLCFVIGQTKVFFGTMGGSIGALNTETMDIEKSLQIDNGAIISMSICDRSLFTGSRSGFVCLIDSDVLTVTSKFPVGNPVTAMCTVGDGVIYALQSDPAFHFRAVDDPQKEVLFSMHPNQFDIGCLAIRDMVQSPIDPNIFLALTDIGRAHIYRYTRGSGDLAVLKVVTHFISDGLTQPQILWPEGPVVLSTSDNRSVVAVDVETDSELFVIRGWEKATRCVAIIGDVLAIGAFDKSIAMYQLTRT
jgi:hypothetical protein